ncbi:MAG: molybdate ABC transporter substrate-binding protein [Nitrososphaeria archaeon]|nr:molybdate ABC transporter substrate-binding protein [Nitrososphaeria archaeon]NIQ33052.1 molybdate ABC transporter substrate-binding protein [Nitrososphaeria archaeon]
MYRKSLTITALVVAVVIVLGSAWVIPKSGEQRKIVAFCGAASKPAMEEAAQRFEEETGVGIELNFGGSGTMLSSISMSKTGDLYIPGSPDYMTKAKNLGLIYPETLKRLAYLVPAIIVQRGNPKNIRGLEDLAKPGIRVGIGDPESVCLGSYALEILKHNELWKRVEKNIVVYAESCSKTAALITIDQVDAIIGWRVFHSWNHDKTEVVYIKPDNIPKLSYIPSAVLVYTDDREGGLEFINFLVSEDGQEIFRRWGYLATQQEAMEYAPNAETPGI